MSRDQTIADSTNCNPSEPEYEAVETGHKVDCDVKLNADHAYQATT